MHNDNNNGPIEVSREEFRAELQREQRAEIMRAELHLQRALVNARLAHAQHCGRLADVDRVPWDEHMARLAESFHAIAGLPGVRPWNADALDAAGRSGLSPASKQAVQFLLAVWNPSHKWRVGRFDAVTAIARWDLRHRGAFEAWVRFPWWP